MNNKGMSMVEVLVGFVVLSIVMAGIFHMIRFGSNMLNESVDIKHSQQNFESEIYKNTIDTAAITDKKIKSLGAADFVLKPSTTPAGNAMQVNNESSIDMFSATAADAEAADQDALNNELHSYTYKDTANDYSIKVYGFRK